MRKRQIHVIQQISVWIFTLAILLQNGIEAPVICLELDGHINIEAGCDSNCEVPVNQTDEHQDNCEDCFDIQLWNYNPDLVFLSQNTELDIDIIDNIYTLHTFELSPEFSCKYITEIDIQQIPPLIKTTILLI
jgi:hypothetical protein